MIVPIGIYVYYQIEKNYKLGKALTQKRSDVETKNVHFMTQEAMPKL